MVAKQTIPTSRLILRPFKISDGPDLYAYLSDERVYLFEPGSPIELEQAYSLAAELTASPDYWAVELKAEHRVIGQLYFQQSEPQDLQTWELGYILNPAYQRQGHAFEALTALLQYAFRTVCIHRVTAHCSPQNPASWKLLEKLGFQREGLLRQNIYFRRDNSGEPRWMDSYVYGLLESDDVATNWCEQ